MKCFPEYTYSIYVDEELPPDEARAVESHLVHCQACRELIVALREEGAMLADVLRDRQREAARKPVGRARARGLAVGGIPLLGIAALASTIVGGMLDQLLPAEIDWMNPLNLFGVYDMIFDTVFLIRDTAPAVFDLAIAVGATVGSAAVMTFLASALLRKLVGPATLGLFVAVWLGVGGAPSTSAALDLRWHEEFVEIGVGERLESTLVVSAQTVDIDGEVDGDVLAMAERINIRGTVKGNVFAAGRDVTVTGKVEGGLHMGCERCNLEGEVQGNVYAGGERVTLHESGRVGRDAQLFGEGVRVDGKVGRDLFAGAGWVELRGEVGGGATTRSERLTVFDGASIHADLDLETPEPGEAIIAPGAQIGGETRKSVLEHPPHGPRNRWLDGAFYLHSAVLMAAAFLVGMLLHALFPALFAGQLRTSAEFLRCIGRGLVALVVTPVVLLLCLLTVVGIPIGVIGAFCYLTGLFLSFILVAVVIGASITGAEPESTHRFGSALLLGLVIVVAAMNVPFVGGLVRVLIAISGLGLLVTGVYDAWRRPIRV